MKIQKSELIDKTISALVKATIFLMPLFFLPWTKEYFEFNKQYLLWLAVPVVAILMLIQMFNRRAINFRRTPLDLPIIIFLLLTFISSLFGLDRFSSWFGYYGRFSDAWLGLMSLTLFYFIVVQLSAEGKLKPTKLLKLFLISADIALAVGLASLFGLLDMISASAWSIFAPISFNPVSGSLEGLVVFAAVIMVMALGRLAAGSAPTAVKDTGRLYYLTVILALPTLLIIDFFPAWCVLSGGCCLIIILHIIKHRAETKREAAKIILVAVMALIAIIFLVFPKLDPAVPVLGQALPREVTLDYSNSWQVALKVLAERPVLGSGSGTFAYDFSLYRPLVFNYSAWWQIRFDKSAAYFLELLATGGALTMLSYLLLLSLFVYLNVVLSKKHFKRLPPDDPRLVYWPTWLAVVMAQLLYRDITVTLFLFWLVSALTMAFWREINPAIFPERKLVLSGEAVKPRLIVLILFVGLAGWLVLAGYELKFWLADVVYARADGRENYLVKAVELDPYRYNYLVSLAKNYLGQAQSQALSGDSNKNLRQLQSLVDDSVKQASTALALDPRAVVTQETLGMIYRDIRLLSQGSETWAIKYFAQALALEPTNPVLATELAKAYFNDNQFDQAESYFNRALELKSDYYDAKLGLAKVLLNKGQDSQALSLLDQLTSVSTDPEVYYELGRYYYNHGEINQAVTEFLLALKVSPDYANAAYSLALCYQTKGDKVQALNYFEKVLELNPGDTDVAKRIEELSK